MGEINIAGFLIIVLIVIAIILYLVFRIVKQKQKPVDEPKIEVDKESIETLAEWVKVQKKQADEEKHFKDLKKAEQKQKLEVFKQTKDILKDKLKAQIDQKEWSSLNSVLERTDKGGMGIYIIYNETKDKYYVGQSKQLIKRVKDHFFVEAIARDFLAGDRMSVKFLTANELDSDYRLDHIEKTGIEIFGSDKNGYNKTIGNM